MYMKKMVLTTIFKEKYTVISVVKGKFGKNRN